MNRIDSSPGDSNEIQKKDVYDLYAEFERRFLQWSIAISPVEWVQLYYRKTFRLKTRAQFTRWFERKSPTAQNFHRQRWEAGFDAWLESEQRRDKKLLDRMKEHGPPPDIERMVTEKLRHYHELFPQKQKPTDDDLALS